LTLNLALVICWGEFHTDVWDRTITLDDNERIDTSEYTQHVF